MVDAHGMNHSVKSNGILENVTLRRIKQQSQMIPWMDKRTTKKQTKKNKKKQEAWIICLKEKILHKIQ